MLFNSFAYVVFLPIVFAIYWILKEQHRWILLLTASYFFYMCSGPQYGVFIFGVTIVSYFSAIVIEKYSDERKKKAALVVTVLVCMGVLFFFKYFNFFSDTVNSWMNLMGIRHEPIILNVVLPVGISFYTFQTMSYVIDVYRGITKAEYHFGRYATFGDCNKLDLLTN